MFAFAEGRSPAKVARAAIAPLLIAAATTCQAGCAADNNAYYATTPVVAAYSRQAAADVQVEGDGLPSQPAPPARITQMPDDPSQPYSRNYGGPNPAAIEPAPAEPAGHVREQAQAQTPAAIPADLPPTFRRQLAQAGYVVD
jgi:hypothetical protein